MVIPDKKSLKILNTVSLPYPPRRSFKPQLEGLRGVAALGVMITHVAFQTGVDPRSPLGAILARFDYFVAVFFAFSAFLLWRGMDFRWGVVLRYFGRRFWRVVPAYWVYVVVALALVPESFGASWVSALATLTFTQMYLPDGFLGGMTHLWSLCVEVVFYLVMPLLGWLLRDVSPPRRIAVFIFMAVLSLGWAFLPFVDRVGGVNMQIFFPGFFCWYAVGLIAAEVETLRLVRVFRHRWVWWVVALAVMWLAGQEWVGPLGLKHPSAWEFTVRVLLGTVVCACVFLPYAFDESPSFLDWPVMSYLGKISYSIFLWHLAVLGAVLPLLGIRPFAGGFLVVLVLTFIGTVLVSSCGYVLVERPFRSSQAAKETLLRFIS